MHKYQFIVDDNVRYTNVAYYQNREHFLNKVGSQHFFILPQIKLFLDIHFVLIILFKTLC